MRNAIIAAAVLCVSLLTVAPAYAAAQDSVDFSAPEGGTSSDVTVGELPEEGQRMEAGEVSAVIEQTDSAAREAAEQAAVSEAAEEGKDTESETAAAAEDTGEGTYLGIFSTTGYSNPGGSLCATGAVPVENHTVSTDWSVLPPGTRIRFGGSSVIYTVEDCGVHGNMVDVYYDTTAEADAHGLVQREVYLMP